MDYYKDEAEINEVVAGFEQCTTAKDKFTHQSHLVVGTSYLRDTNPEEAFQKMRAGLLRFLDDHGIDRGKYKDDITRKWIVLIQNVLEEMNAEDSLLTVTNAVVERLALSQLVE